MHSMRFPLTSLCKASCIQQCNYGYKEAARVYRSEEKGKKMKPLWKSRAKRFEEEGDWGGGEEEDEIEEAEGVGGKWETEERPSAELSDKMHSDYRLHHPIVHLFNTNRVSGIKCIHGDIQRRWRVRSIKLTSEKLKLKNSSTESQFGVT